MNLAWTVEFDEAAAKEFRKLPHPLQQQIRNYLRTRVLPHPQQFGKALRHSKVGLWRYRIGKYRLICSIEHSQLVVLVLRIAKRDQVYDKDLDQ